MDKTEVQVALERLEAEEAQVAEKMAKLHVRLSQIRADAESVRRAWALLGDGSEIEPARDDGSTPKTFAEALRQADRRGELIREVRHIILSLPADRDITSEVIRDRLAAGRPDLVQQIHKSSIPGTLAQLVKVGALVLIHRGSGRKHSVYRRVPVASELPRSA